MCREVGGCDYDACGLESICTYGEVFFKMLDT